MISQNSKQSDKIRLQIGQLIREQMIYQNEGRDSQLDHIETQIEKLRSKLLLVEEEEKKLDHDFDDHG